VDCDGVCYSVCYGVCMSVQGGAVKAGMMIARGRQLLMADADGATRVSDLAKLEAVMKNITDPG